MIATDDIPDDQDGDVLRQMRSAGDSLQAARDIDFSVIFVDEQSAVAFCERTWGGGLKLSYRRSDVDEACPWDVTVVRNMVPDHAEILRMQDRLQSIAEGLNGQNDGWGCFTINDMLTD
jgi:hypothetical protein